MQPLPRRALALLTALALTVGIAASAPVASAHQGNPAYRSVIDGIVPPELAEGIEVEVVNYDDHVSLTNRSGREVIILGYEGEPYIRFQADGVVDVNLNAPTHYLNEDRFANVEMPSRADADAAPDWDEVNREGRFEWHDHRSHYMSEGIPPQVKDESVRTKVLDYTIPMTVGGEPAKIEGTLWWHGQETGVPVLPFILLGVAVLAGLAFLWHRRRQGAQGSEEAESW